MSEGEKSSSTNVGCLGCLSTILVIIALWALLFGVTIGDKHYGISCTCNRGVLFEEK